MKRTNYKRKLISYVVIWSLFLSSFLLYSPKNVALSASGVPEIAIITPNAGAMLDVSTVEFTGTISEDQTSSDKLSIKIFEQLGDSQQPIEITGEGKLSITMHDKYADFSFLKDFNDGVHNLTFVVTDENGVSNKIDHSFTITGGEQSKNTSMAIKNGLTNQGQTSAVEITTSQLSIVSAAVNLPADEQMGKRPYMEKMFLIPKGLAGEYEPGKIVPETFLPAEDMTRVPLNYEVLIDVRSSEPITTTQPLVTFFGEITGKEKKIKTSKLSDEISAYIYTFTPDKPFDPRTTYYVYLNPNFSNGPGENIIPRFLKFTTVSANHQDVKDLIQDPDTNLADIPDHKRSLDFNIHGNFSNVTNACAYCHSAHNGKNESLEGGIFGNDEENVCMACHDGTTGTKIAPKVADHKAELKTNQHVQSSGSSCTSCHNPHIPGTPENPNSFKAISDKDSHIRTYKKASTATGKADDFSLCLSCHNGKKDEKSQKVITDIKQYYSSTTYISQSGHKITAAADSGSNLDGQIPCAECHETHSSNNIKMLRAELGNIKITDDKDKFISSGIEWNAENEREFCSKCHNGSTQIYGVTGKAIYDKETGKAINPDNPDHNKGTKNEEKACSACHSNGGDNAFREAAHAPKKITNP
ncbi:cytochrome C family protein [Neobacillus bataviensis LMG 21833]|uniref:Cytochrome C family protein n=1 Tax=Neobacillus bataviensis LMG 21833 TaxID=1117379 RepID=K6DT00_9BACI|nr:cytochrome c3 family protein [Neobacillus bataviensis]EKN71373.1 cytochrome C family protein [Neobacillus bataviensis LMG 21833]